MKIAVLGGNGLIGTRLVSFLRREDHEVVAASAGASVVIDVSDPPCSEHATVTECFDASVDSLLTAAARAGVKHHVALSVVGIERWPRSGYARMKLAQEERIKQSSVPYSIIRSTQLFEALQGMADAATHDEAVRVPPVLIQPIAADDVVEAVARTATGTPLNGTAEIGGPERFYLDGLVQRVLGARNDPREVIADPRARYFEAELRERSLLPGDEADLGRIRFDDWLGHGAPALAPLKENEFRTSEVPPGSVLLVGDVAVFNIEGAFCATQAMCTHRQGPLSEGTLDGWRVACPLHGAQFDVWTGAALRGPARDPLKTYAVTVDGDVGRVELPRLEAVEGA